jgi:transposase
MIRTRNEVGGMTETLGGAWDIIRSEVAAKTAQCMRVPTLLQIKRDSGQCALCRARDKAHCRRYFDEAKKVGSEAGQAKVALEFIGRLSMIERPLWERDHPLTPAQRVEVRQKRSAPIMRDFHAWLEALAPKVLPESRIGKAVFYALGQWQKLCVFLTHGEAPMTNNRVENAIRPFALGRKGWLFADTVKGAAASANLFSLIETCKANGVEPHAYLTFLFERLPHLKTVEDYEAVLPWNARCASRPASDQHVQVQHVRA